MRRGWVSLLLGVVLALVVGSVAIPASPAGAITVTHVGFMDSEPGEPLGNGRQTYYPTSVVTGSQATITVTLQSPSEAGPLFYTVVFAPTTAAGVLTPGIYEDTRMVADATHPQLAVSSPLHSCSAATTTGRFLLDELVTSSGGTVIDRFAMRIELHCDGADPALFGSIRGVNTPTSYPYEHRFYPESAFTDFGNQSVGLWSSPQYVEIYNQSTTPLTVSGLSVTGTNPGDFVITDDVCSGATLAFDEGCIIVVVFAPTAVGVRTAEVTFFDELAPSGGGGTGRDLPVSGIGVVPTTQGEFIPVPPTRILDMRTGLGSPWGAGPGLGTREQFLLSVAGVPPIPVTGVEAVVMNVTAVPFFGAPPSFVTVFPSGSDLPLVSNLNFAGAQPVPNLVTVKLGPDGKVRFYNDLGGVHLIADVVGYYADASPAAIAGSRFHGVTPTRLLDTRSPSDPHFGKVGFHGEVLLQVAGIPAVPAGATGVVLNVTATEPTAPSFVTVYPDEGSRPGSSNLNFIPGQTVPNAVIIKVPTNGRIRLFNDVGTVHLVVDVVGYFDDVKTTEAGRFVPIEPARFMDTRFFGGPLGFGGTRLLSVVAGAGIPPTGVDSVVMNVTVTEPTFSSFLTVYPADATRPNASSLNFVPGKTIPNLVTVKASSSNGEVMFFNNLGSVHVIADLAGYYSS